LKRLLSAIWLALLLGGCGQQVSFALPEEDLSLEIYGQDRPAAHCSVPAGSPQHHTLAAWLAKNDAGWQPSMASYVPGILVRGKTISLAFVGSLAVINVEGGQFTHAVARTEYAFLRCQ
jgi:hypothetical protein